MISCYVQYRQELINYGQRFDGTRETAEDLFEACYDALAKHQGSLLLPEIGYLKLMKKSMENRFKDHYRRAKLLAQYPYPETLLPTAPASPEEKVCQREEMELLMLALARLSTKDRTILLEVGTREQVTSNQRYQAKGRLQQQLIQVIAHPFWDRKPSCPYCQSASLYFMLDTLDWVCEQCGQVTKVPTPGKGI